jgi:hypothetical protein
LWLGPGGASMRITWFTLSRRSAPLAAQVVKGAGCEGRGNAFAALAVGSGRFVNQCSG